MDKYEAHHYFSSLVELAAYPSKITDLVKYSVIYEV